MSKDNCRTSKTQLPKSWAVGQLKFDLLCTSGCTKQLPQSQKTTVEKLKDNCRIIKRQLPKSWAVKQLNFVLLCATGKTKQLPNRQKANAETEKNNSQTIKKQLQVALEVNVTRIQDNEF